MKKLTIIALLFSALSYAQQQDSVATFVSLKGKLIPFFAQSAPNFDNQAITDFSITGNTLTLTLENGGTETVDLSPYLDNTDAQTVTDFSLSGNILSITLSGGNTQTVDLSTISGGSSTPADDSVTPAKMADADHGAISWLGGVASIDDNTITESKIQAGTITGTRIQDGSIGNTDLAFGNSGTNGQVPVRNGGGFLWQNLPNDDQNATEVPMTDYVEGTDATAPDDTDNVAEAIAKLKNITDALVASTYPSTANQILVSYHTSKVTVHDSMFAAASLYDGRELNFTVTDTLELGNDVTSAHYNEWMNFRALDLDGNGPDSVLVRPIDNNKILMNGNALPTNAGNNYIVLPNEYGSIKKLNDSIWDVSIIDKYDGVPVAEITAVYQGANAADPVNEVNGINGITVNATDHLVTSASTVTPQNGTYYLRFVQNVGDNSLSKSFIELTGVQAGQNVTVSFWVYEAQGTFWEGKLRTNLEDGVSDWSPEVSVNFDSQGIWTEYTLTSTASVNNPRLRISTTSLGDLNDEILIDNITVTIN
jgi:hypothetical protein